MVSELPPLYCGSFARHVVSVCRRVVDCANEPKMYVFYLIFMSSPSKRALAFLASLMLASLCVCVCMRLFVYVSIHACGPAPIVVVPRCVDAEQTYKQPVC